MQKRLFWLLTVLVTVTLVVAACGGATPAPPAEEQPAEAPAAEVPATEQPPEAAAPAEPTEAAAEPAEEVAAAEPTEAAAEAMSLEIEPIKIAIVMPSTISDLAWSQAMYDALTRVQADAGGERQYDHQREAWIGAQHP